MANPDETRRVVQGYFDAWTSKRVDDARALLDEQLEFVGPTARYQGAKAFEPALAGFAQMTRGARMVELLVDGDRAAMLYECDLPFGTVRIASFFRVAGGKIRWYETQFDATELRKLQAAR
jgi:hypothetical protein